jgi:hypothetical protein
LSGARLAPPWPAFTAPAGFLSLKLDASHKDLLSAIDRQGANFERRLDQLQTNLARLDERTRGTFNLPPFNFQPPPARPRFCTWQLSTPNYQPPHHSIIPLLHYSITPCAFALPLPSLALNRKHAILAFVKP